MSFNLLINEPAAYHGVDFSKYNEFSNIFYEKDKFSDNEINAICVSLKEVVDDNKIRNYNNLKYIVSNTTATDHIKISRKISIINLNSKEIKNISATAEFTLALMLSLVRKIPFINQKNLDDRLEYRGMQLQGKNLGIIGYGRIGRYLSAYAKALKMNCITFDKKNDNKRKIKVFNESDIISIHLPLNANTVNFLRKDDFYQMKKKPYIINTSRPQIINKKSLIYAIENNLISGAAMDFLNYNADFKYDKELKKYIDKKLFMTPHIAGNTHDSVNYTANIVINKLAKAITKSI